MSFGGNKVHLNLKQGFPVNKTKGYLSFNAWSPLKGHAYFNKPAAESCKFADGVLARNSKLRPFGPNWENLEVAPVTTKNKNAFLKVYPQISYRLACVSAKNV